MMEGTESKHRVSYLSGLLLLLIQCQCLLLQRLEMGAP